MSGPIVGGSERGTSKGVWGVGGLDSGLSTWSGVSAKLERNYRFSHYLNRFRCIMMRDSSLEALKTFLKGGRLPRATQLAPTTAYARREVFVSPVHNDIGNFFQTSKENSQRWESQSVKTYCRAASGDMVDVPSAASPWGDSTLATNVLIS